MQSSARSNADTDRTRAHPASSRAFDVAELEAAIVWRREVQPLGYRLFVTSAYEDADEAIVVTVVGLGKPLFKITRLRQWVQAVGPGGQRQFFVDVQRALLSIADPGPAARRHMLHVAARSGTGTWDLPQHREATGHLWQRIRSALLAWRPGARE